MGFFRRYKLTDHTADECRAECKRIAQYLSLPIDLETEEETEEYLLRWACFRELLARHQKSNQPLLDLTSGGKDYLLQLVFDTVQLSSIRLTIPKLVVRLQEDGVGERLTREAVQYLVDAGKLELDSMMVLVTLPKGCPYVMHTNDCNCGINFEN